MKHNWVSKALFEFGEVISGGTPSTSVNEYWDGDIVWITPADLSKIHFPGMKTSGKKITAKGLNSSSANLIPAGSIVMSSRAPIGYFAVPSVDFSTNQGCKSVKLKEGNVPLFHYYNFVFNVNIFKRRGEGTTFAEISKKEVEKLYFTFPDSQHVQRKMADILSTCDEVIEKTEAAIAKYQALKQGMMEDLFTRGIDSNTGKLRPTYQDTPELYKESDLGMIPNEWEEGQLIDFADERISHSFTGGPFGSDLQTKHYVREGVRIIQLQNIGDGHFNNGYKIYTSQERANYLRACNIYPGEIILSKMADPIARACIIPNHSERYLMASDGIRLSINKEKFNLRFVLETINHARFRTFAEIRSTGTTRSRIGLTDLKRIPVCYPEIVEQNLIGQKLGVLEDSISFERSALAKYQQLKAGLMHDLLTGEKEVTVDSE